MSVIDGIQLIERYDRTVAALEAETVERINAALDASFRNLERELRRKYPTLAANDSLLPSQRKLLLLNELGDSLQLIRPNQAADYDKILSDALQLSNESGADLASQLTQAIASETLDSVTDIPIEAVALQAQNGRKRLQRWDSDFQDKASAVVEQGLVQGWGANRVAQGIRQQLGATKSQAESIARTELLSSLNQAAQQQYSENGILYFQWFATADDRTCPYCVARNGNVYRIGKVPIPCHPRCRCYSSPWKAEWQKAGLTDDAWMQDFRQQALDELKASGKQPNNGITPFERAAGLSKPPKPVWSVEEGLNQDLLVKTPTPTPKPKPAQPKSEPAQPKPKPSEASLQSRDYNPYALKNLTVEEFSEFREQREFLREQDSSDSVWNQSLSEFQKRSDYSTAFAKRQYKQEVLSSIDLGYAPSEQALSEIGKLSSKQQKTLDSNLKEIAQRREKVTKIQQAIDHPLMSEAEQKGYKPLLSRQAAREYTSGSYTGTLGFYHGNSPGVIESMTTEGILPELNSRGIYGQGAYFSTSKSVAEQYSRASLAQGESGVIEVQAKLKRPFVATSREVEAIGTNFDGDQSNGIDSKAVTEYLRAKGHDSIYLKDRGYLITFDQKQTVIVERESIKLGSDRANKVNDFWKDKLSSDDEIEVTKKSASYQALEAAK